MRWILVMILQIRHLLVKMKSDCYLPFTGKQVGCNQVVAISARMLAT
jgi:hypothetical protein